MGWRIALEGFQESYHFCSAHKHTACSAYLDNQSVFLDQYPHVRHAVPGGRGYSAGQTRGGVGLPRQLHDSELSLSLQFCAVHDRPRIHSLGYSQRAWQQRLQMRDAGPRSTWTQRKAPGPSVDGS